MMTNNTSTIYREENIEQLLNLVKGEYVTLILNNNILIQLNILYLGSSNNIHIYKLYYNNNILLCSLFTCIGLNRLYLTFKK